MCKKWPFSSGLPIWGILMLCVAQLHAQVSADCADAVPICHNTPINGGTQGYGIDDFNGAQSTGCITNATGTLETNSAWYRFKTGEAGQLGINIGFDVSEDWDFALYRANGCNTLGEPVRCNYFDNTEGNSFTGFGADPTGMANFQYDDWLQVAPGEEYYLMINNFSDTNSGFSVQFSGSIFEAFPNTALDCSIVTNLLGPPIAACENEPVQLNAHTLGAVGYEWYMDQGDGFELLPTATLPTYSPDVSGTYRVIVEMPDGSDIISQVQVRFSPIPIAQPMADEILCLDGTPLDLSLKSPEVLGTQSGADFRVSYHLAPGEALDGSNPLDREYWAKEGEQTIYVRLTSNADPNCFDFSQSFMVLGMALPVLDVDTEVYICEDTPVGTIGQRVPEPNVSYTWSSGQVSSQITVTKEGTYTLTAEKVYEGLRCTDEREITVVFSRPPVIDKVDIAYNDQDNSVTVHLLQAGDFEFQLDNEEPRATNSFNNVLPGPHTLTVTDINGCGSVSEEIVVVGFPQFFSPNGDGVNDVWNIEGWSVLKDPVVTIYDRYGKFIAQLNANSAGWNGLLNGKPAMETDYWFKLTYTNGEGNTVTAKHINSHFTLKR